jgi:hypothetical protein
MRLGPRRPDIVRARELDLGLDAHVVERPLAAGVPDVEHARAPVHHRDLVLLGRCDAEVVRVQESAERERPALGRDLVRRPERRAARLGDADLVDERLRRALELALDLAPRDVRAAVPADRHVRELDFTVASADRDRGRAGPERGVAAHGEVRGGEVEVAGPGLQEVV